MSRSLNIHFFGSSLVSAYWNGAATYYRGLIKALHARGHRVTFCEPDAFGRQQHRDLPDPDWATVRVYDPTQHGQWQALLSEACAADVVIKASGVGVLDAELERGVLECRRAGNLVLFWDVDAPATLDRLDADDHDPFHDLVPAYDLICTYGGGPPVVQAYAALDAKACVPVYNAVDPAEHFPVPPDPQFAVDMTLLANRLPDREARIDAFFFEAARRLPDRRFVLGGSGWEQPHVPPNVRCAGHVYTKDHNAFHASPTAALSVNRKSMAAYGYSPATRIFEAAGAGACIISDAWEGIELFLEPGTEILVAEDGEWVAEHLANLTPERAAQIGQAALQRVRREHTYTQRAEQLETLLLARLADKAVGKKQEVTA
ncbi:MAG: glycosyltransferase [Phycisphaerae bacterium]